MTRIKVYKPTEQELEQQGVLTWPVWTCEPSRFDWHYEDREVCYLIAGKVTVTTGDEVATFGAGDMVEFPQGMDCVWDVAEAVKKHYRFG